MQDTSNIEFLNLNEGTRLDLQLLDKEKLYFSLVSYFFEAIDNETALIATPIYKNQLYIIKDTLIDIYIILNKNLYKFRAKVLNNEKKGNISLLKIQKTSMIEQIQRRQHFRLDCILPMKYCMQDQMNMDEGYVYKNAFVKNISGGGICVHTDYQILEKEPFKCEIVIDDGKVIELNTKLIWSKKIEKLLIKKHNQIEYDIGLKFEGISTTSREMIIRYIFKEQRRLLKRVD